MVEPRIVQSCEASPFGCRCRMGTAPFIDTGLEDAIGRVYLCIACMGRFARLFGFVALVDHEALQEQYAISSRHEQQLLTDLDVAHKQLQSGELERLRDELEETRQERDSFSRRAFEAERSLQEWETGDEAKARTGFFRSIGADFASSPIEPKTKEAA